MAKNKKNKAEKGEKKTKREVPKGFGGGAARKDKDLILFIGKKKVVFEHFSTATLVKKGEKGPKALEPIGAVRVTHMVDDEKIQTIVNLNSFTHWSTSEHKAAKKVKK